MSNWPAPIFVSYTGLPVLGHVWPAYVNEEKEVKDIEI